MQVKRFGGFGRAVAAIALALLAACSQDTGMGVIGTAPVLKPHPAPGPGEPITYLFLPFVGVPVGTGDPLYRQIRTFVSKHTKQYKMTLAMRLDEPATYRIKPYLQALGTGTSTIITYQVEIYDADGTRVHTFGGQETAPAVSGDPWGNVDQKTLEHLAAAMVEGVMAWSTRAHS